MKGLLIYFSGTGNSKFIAKRIKNEFIKQGHEVTLYSIEENLTIDWESYDFLILGSPKYYEHTPLFFINWIENNVPKLPSPINVIIFCTASAPVATSFKYLQKILEKKNCYVVTTKTFQMPNNYSIGMFSTTSEEKYEIYSKWSGEKAALMIENFLYAVYSIEKINGFIGFLCKNVSSFFCNSAKHKSKNFSVNSDCIKCKQCIKNCPNDNIEIKNDKIVFKNNCIFCTRCINSCPKNAILYKNKKPKQYTYNLNELEENKR
ncbi:EFR1 family ferrodoxin [Clostridium ganghwense]|uniref:EFR1 family ferrodoxin n=1 Tax=Clostridium ganghwense TaxID=312089 RepID=A0ABT4CUN1_9CLOT|nr:EFR1 family ferrodoxin [Clostridium ganghwense]MCY6372148.1 EFR1 family ferrodoxin [Clostridium ganghwense]